MKLRTNEKGGALLMVLLLLVILLLFGILAFTLNTTANKQFDKKEANVQARYLAEMGVLHFKDVLKEEVNDYNASEIYLIYDEIDGKQVLNLEESRKKYYQGLCGIASGMSIPATETETGTYSYQDLQASCSSGEIKVMMASNGHSKNGGTKLINAAITIAPVEGGEEIEPGPNPPVEDGVPPTKPASPQKERVTTLDDIGKLTAVEVVHGQTRKEPYSTNAFVEILGAVDMPKNTTWMFNDHLLINGSFSMKTTGIHDSVLTVQKDLFIGEALHTENHNKINISGNMIVRGNTNIGNWTIMTIDGSVLFDSVVESVWPHAKVTINQNAYFKEELTKVKKNAFCVSGDVYLWKGKWVPYTSQYDGYLAFDKSCLGNAPTNPVPPSNGDFDWRVLPSVDADYNVSFIQDEDTFYDVFSSFLL